MKSLCVTDNGATAFEVTQILSALGIKCINMNSSWASSKATDLSSKNSFSFDTLFGCITDARPDIIVVDGLLRAVRAQNLITAIRGNRNYDGVGIIHLKSGLSLVAPDETNNRVVVIVPPLTIYSAQMALGRFDMMVEREPCQT